MGWSAEFLVFLNKKLIVRHGDYKCRGINFVHRVDVNEPVMEFHFIRNITEGYNKEWKCIITTENLQHEVEKMNNWLPSKFYPDYDIEDPNIIVVEDLNSDIFETGMNFKNEIMFEECDYTNHDVIKIYLDDIKKDKHELYKSIIEKKKINILLLNISGMVGYKIADCVENICKDEDGYCELLEKF